MSNEQRTVETRINTLDDQHGLCDSAETHWAIYLIELVKAGKKPSIHEAALTDGGFVKFLQKGEDLSGTGLSFGADSLLVVSSSDPSLEYMLFVEEGNDVLSGRPLHDFEQALQDNDYYDTDIPSRWKTIITEYAQGKGIEPKQISLVHLVRELRS